MFDILHEVTIEASPDKVYQAITEEKGLAGWWTTHTTAQAKVGTISEFGFEGGNMIFKMKVDKLEPGHTVQWTPLQGAPDWGGTVVTWDLTPVEKGTKLLFGHRNYASTEGPYASVNFNWGWFLASLKAYVETSKGMPYSY